LPITLFQQPARPDNSGAGDLRATLVSVREAMSDLAEDLEALKHSFFFRGFFKDRGFYDLGTSLQSNISPRNSRRM
jgi:hypothetical protein